MGRAVEEKSSLLKNLETADDLKIIPLRHHTNRLVTMSNISINYGEKAVISGFNLSIENGDRIALCGKNGSGKSSIIKLICGDSIQHNGNFQAASCLKISYVSQDTSLLKGNLTDYAAENNIDESLFKAILRKLDFSRVQFDKDMCDFSGGQKKKTLIARSLCQQAHLLVWDEPLNFIDVLSRMQIEEMLLQYQPTILFVEHDSMFCDKVATKQITI